MATPDENSRPDPDELLAEVTKEEAQARHGRLKIFFGASPGVGKTFAMLQALQERQREGLSVMIGIVETHGRVETEALLEGLPRLPLKSVVYRGRTLSEFDLDSALASSAALIAIDELAHSNVPGSRHAKRWQDVEELLVAGFDVYTAFNVQHLETLNDVVARITGVRVRETIPDRIFDKADEVILVDLPAEDLIKRLHAGKVYLREAASAAVERFFRPGNLIALRELALRRVADRVDVQMRAYRSQHAIETVWPAHERLLVAIGGGDDEPLIREAARLATKLEAEWIAVHVDRSDVRLEKSRRELTLNLLALADRLGAQTATIPGNDVAQTLIDYARIRNANRLIIGWLPLAPWKWWRKSLVERIARCQPGLDLVVVPERRGRTGSFSRPWARARSRGVAPYAWASAACGLATLVALPLAKVFDLSNIVMLFLLTVVLVSLRFGRSAGAWAALLAVLCFDFFFVPPRLSFSVSDVQYLFTFGLMLIVALIIGQLTARLRFTATAARQREQRAALQARLARELSGALTLERILDIALETIEGAFDACVAIALPDNSGRIKTVHSSRAEVDESIAQWVLDHGEAAGAGTETLSATRSRYLPLKAPMNIRGVLVLQIPDDRLQEPEELRLLQACANQIAIALERTHFVEVAQDTVVQMESERMRNTLLATLSHDLRTPLTGILGSAEVAARYTIDAKVDELLTQIRNQAKAMQRLLENLLQLAKLQSGGVKLDLQWQSIEEIVGSAIGQVTYALQKQMVRADLPASLPFAKVDALLLERAIVNLLDNAAKYTPPGSIIDISVRSLEGWIEFEVADNGPGLPQGNVDALFEAFRRGHVESSISGIGLGLSLVMRVAEAHGGTVVARRLNPHGSAFVIRIPQRSPNQEEVE